MYAIGYTHILNVSAIVNFHYDLLHSFYKISQHIIIIVLISGWIWLIQTAEAVVLWVAGTVMVVGNIT